MLRRTLLAAFLALPLLAQAANLAGAWAATDRVCKRACTKEDPEPDFEIRTGIILIQRGSIVCGLRNQNTLADKSITIPLRGWLKGSHVEIESGEARYDDDEPTFPFKVESRGRLLLKRRVLIEATSEGHEFAKYKPEPQSPAEAKQYLEANRAYFDACFASRHGASP